VVPSRFAQCWRAMVFDIFEKQMRELGYTKRMYDLLVCCDPLTQLTCSWLKFASNVRWPTLCLKCQQEEFRKWLIANLAIDSLGIPPNRLIGTIFAEYATQREAEEVLPP